MADKVPFDPGIGNLVLNLYSFYDEFNFKFSNLRSIQQKKTFFKIYAPKLEKYIINNISFLTGCLLWAYYLVNNYKNSPKEIEGNIFYNEKEYNYMEQIEFLKNLISEFQRNYTYFIGKKYELPERWNNIIRIYSDFLKLNNGFINVFNTSDINLPDELINVSFNFDINNIINKVITENNLKLLYDLENFIV